MEDTEQLQEKLLEKQDSQQYQAVTQMDREAKSPLSEDEGVQLVIKDEDQPVLHNAYEHSNGNVLPSLPQDCAPLKSDDCDVFPVATMPPHQGHPLPNSHTPEQWQHGVLEYKVPPGALANVEKSRTKEGQNQVGMVLPTLKQEPLTSPEIPPERAEPLKKKKHASVLIPSSTLGVILASCPR